MYRIHTPETAAAASRAGLEQARRSYGFIPNLYGIFAESPALLEANHVAQTPLDPAFEPRRWEGQPAGVR